MPESRQVLWPRLNPTLRASPDSTRSPQPQLSVTTCRMKSCRRICRDNPANSSLNRGTTFGMIRRHVVPGGVNQGADAGPDSSDTGSGDVRSAGREAQHRCPSRHQDDRAQPQQPTPQLAWRAENRGGCPEGENRRGEPNPPARQCFGKSFRSIPGNPAGDHGVQPGQNAQQLKSGRQHHGQPADGGGR
jgi:hypothetical protein